MTTADSLFDSGRHQQLSRGRTCRSSTTLLCGGKLYNSSFPRAGPIMVGVSAAKQKKLPSILPRPPGPDSSSKRRHHHQFYPTAPDSIFSQRHGGRRRQGRKDPHQHEQRHDGQRERQHRRRQQSQSPSPSPSPPSTARQPRPSPAGPARQQRRGPSPRRWPG